MKCDVMLKNICTALCHLRSRNQDAFLSQQFFNAETGLNIAMGYKIKIKPQTLIVEPHAAKKTPQS